MKILAATSDPKTSAVISAAVRFRWPTTGYVEIVSDSANQVLPNRAGFDLMVVDCSLHWSVEQIQKLSEMLSDMPILYLADPYGDQMDTASAIISLGNSDYLFKPLEIDALVSSIESLINSPGDSKDFMPQTGNISLMEDNN